MMEYWHALSFMWWHELARTTANVVVGTFACDRTISPACHPHCNRHCVRKSWSAGGSSLLIPPRGPKYTPNLGFQASLKSHGLHSESFVNAIRHRTWAKTGLLLYPKRLLLSKIPPLEPNTSVANYIEPLAGPINDFIEPL